MEKKPPKEVNKLNLSYDYKRPKYLNYGGIGTAVGHELMHTLENPAAYGGASDDKSEKQLSERAQCLSRQYANLSSMLHNLTADVASTQKEDVADMGGIKGAYKSYRKHSIMQNPFYGRSGFFSPTSWHKINSKAKTCVTVG